MPSPVVAGATITCSFGTKPGNLVVTIPTRPLVENRPVAVVADNVPTTNVTPFLMCTSLANPQVASATAAAQGVLTPQPCVPLTIAPWAPGASKVSVGGQPVLTNTSTCNCAWGGAITVTDPGTTKVTVA